MSQCREKDLVRNLSRYLTFIFARLKISGTLDHPATKKGPLELESYVTGARDEGVVIFSLGTLGDAILQKNHVEQFSSSFRETETESCVEIKE